MIYNRKQTYFVLFISFSSIQLVSKSSFNKIFSINFHWIDIHFIANHISLQIMDIKKAIDQSQQISEDLTSICKNPQKASEIINGMGFSSLYAYSDFLPGALDQQNLQGFITDYLASMTQLTPKIYKALQTFCLKLHLIKELKWHKFQTLFDCQQGGKGSWIGVYFRKLPDNKCQFVSNHLKCAFTLMPDVYVLKETQTDKFLCFKQTESNFKLVENKRNFTVNDYRSLMDVCGLITNLKVLEKLKIQQ